MGHCAGFLGERTCQGPACSTSLLEAHRSHRVQRQSFPSTPTPHHCSASPLSGSPTRLLSCRSGKSQWVMWWEGHLPRATPVLFHRPKTQRPEAALDGAVKTDGLLVHAETHGSEREARGLQLTPDSLPVRHPGHLSAGMSDTSTSHCLPLPVPVHFSVGCHLLDPVPAPSQRARALALQLYPPSQLVEAERVQEAPLICGDRRRLRQVLQPGPLLGGWLWTCSYLPAPKMSISNPCPQP